jgi:hypothetical protein
MLGADNFPINMIDSYWSEPHGRSSAVCYLPVPRVQDINREISPAGRSIAMLALILAGEAVFFLPFVLPRIFRPTLLEVFHVTNLQLGSSLSPGDLICWCLELAAP